MKTLRGLDDKPQVLEEPKDKKVLDQLLTYRQLAKMVIGGCTAKNGNESIDLTQAGLKLKCEGDVQLEDAEFRLLKDKVEENEAKLTAPFQGQLLIKLKEVEMEADKKEPAKKDA